MPVNPASKSAFENLRPTIIREPARSSVSSEAEARLLAPTTLEGRSKREVAGETPKEDGALKSSSAPLLLKKKRERLLLVSFRMPQGLKERLELVAKKHEINQTDIINEAIQINLQRYM
jgi:hypothetical protein